MSDDKDNSIGEIADILVDSIVKEKRYMKDEFSNRDIFEDKQF